MTTMAEPQAISAMLDKYRGRNVLAVGSHPNDIEAGAGGTLARLSDADAHLTMVIVTVPHHLEDRMAEAGKSARILGGDLRVLYPEKEMRVEDIKSYVLIDQMDKLVRELDPAVVFTHAASNFHQDNVLVHKAFMSAQRLHFFDMFCFYPTNCHPITTPFHPNVWVDITSTVERKLSAIDQYETQFKCRGIATDIYRGTAQEYGRLAGTAYAEGFEVGRLTLG